MPSQDIVRVLRIVEYVGPRDQVEEQVRRSIHGRCSFVSAISIRATTIGEFPDILNAAEKEKYLADSTTAESDQASIKTSYES